MFGPFAMITRSVESQSKGNACLSVDHLVCQINKQEFPLSSREVKREVAHRKEI